MITKARILEVIEQLPDDVSIDQVIAKLHFLERVSEGLREADAGEVIDHEELKKELLAERS